MKWAIAIDVIVITLGMVLSYYFDKCRLSIRAYVSIGGLLIFLSIPILMLVIIVNRRDDK